MSNFGPANSSTVNLVPLQGVLDTNGNVTAVISPNGTPLPLSSIPPLAFSLDSNAYPKGLIAPSGAVIPIYKGLKNFKLQNYPITRKALANRVSNNASFQVLCIGDSTTQGSDGISATNSTNRAWPTAISKILTAKGMQTGSQNVMGNHLTNTQSSNISLSDPRVTTLPSNWTTTLAQFGFKGGIGGYAFVNTSDTTPITFTPTVPTDTLDVFYFDGAGYNQFSILTGAGGVTTPSTGGTVVPAGTNRIKKATATTTLGSNVWTLQRTATGSTMIVQGFSAYNSTLPEISLYNCGCGGAQTTFFTQTSNYWESLNEVSLAGNALISPLAIIDLGINNWNNVNYAAQNALADLTTIATALQAAGTEMLFIVPVPSVTTFATAANQAAIVAAIYQVAYAFNSAIIDITERWVSQSAVFGAGYYGDTGIHPSIMGYGDKASAIAEFFLAF